LTPIPLEGLQGGVVGKREGPHRFLFAMGWCSPRWGLPNTSMGLFNVIQAMLDCRDDLTLAQQKL